MLQTLPRPASTLVVAAHHGGRHEALRAGHLLLAAGVLLALASAALAVDMPLARAVAALDIPYDFRHFVRLGEAFGWGGTVGLIILAAAILDPRGWRIVPRLAVLSFGSGLLADGVKLIIARRRPVMTDLDSSVWETFLGWRAAMSQTDLHDDAVQSFPSGHAATATGLAVALAILYPRGRWLFAGLALLAALQRIEVEAHYLSDVLAGAAVGCLVGALCQFDVGLGRLFTRLESRSAAFSPSGRGPG